MSNTYTSSRYRSFYDERRPPVYAQEDGVVRAEMHSRYAELRAFIERFNLGEKRCLEIGSSIGLFQDMVADYWGTDIAESLGQHYHKPYSVAGNAHYPFEDNMFDAIWTFRAFEHIPALQEALLEVKRLLKPGGVVLFAPAWQCRPWAAEGYAVRPYRDFGMKGKLIKASIPLRNSVLWRSLFIFPKRMFRHLAFITGYRYERSRYNKLKANYEVFWTSDSDACNSIDPHDAILWFLGHGFACLSHPSHLSAFLVRTGGIIFRKDLARA